MARTPFKLKSGNSMAGSSFKMMGSSSPLRDPINPETGDHPRAEGEHDQYGDHPTPEWNTPERYEATIQSVTPEMTDSELRQLSRSMRTTQEGVLKGKGKWSASFAELQKQRSSLIDKPTEEVVEPIVTKPVRTVNYGEEIIG